MLGNTLRLQLLPNNLGRILSIYTHVVSSYIKFDECCNCLCIPMLQFSNIMTGFLIPFIGKTNSVVCFSAQGLLLVFLLNLSLMFSQDKRSSMVSEQLTV